MSRNVSSELKITSAHSAASAVPLTPEQRDALRAECEPLVEAAWADLVAFAERRGGDRLAEIFRVLGRSGRALADTIRNFGDADLAVIAAFARVGIAEACARSAAMDAEQELAEVG